MSQAYVSWGTNTPFLWFNYVVESVSLPHGIPTLASDVILISRRVPDHKSTILFSHSLASFMFRRVCSAHPRQLTLTDLEMPLTL